MASPKTVQFYRKKRVMHYDAATKKAFITKRSVRASIKYIIRTIGMLLLVSLRLKKAQEKYRAEGKKLRTLAFWKRYLGV